MNRNTLLAAFTAAAAFPTHALAATPALEVLAPESANKIVLIQAKKTGTCYNRCIAARASPSYCVRRCPR